MNAPSIPFTILSLFFASFLSAQDAREATPPSSPAKSPGAAQAGEAVAKPETVSKEILQLAKFPRMALQFEPTLGAALQLTPGQQEELKKAWEETVGQTERNMAGSEDKIEVRNALVRAQKDFASSRDSILTEQQITLIEAINVALKEAERKAKQARQESGKKVDKRAFFLLELKPSLNADQVALVEAAGGKLP